MADSFAHLHVHTEFSMLDGAARIVEIVKKAKDDGMPGVGCTDHGNMYGIPEFVNACLKAELTPVIGTELYMVEDRFGKPVRKSRKKNKVDDGGEQTESGKAYYHLTTLAETQEGYRNLIQLSSLAFLEGFHAKPRVDWQLLDRYHKGIIATSGCLGGMLLQRLIHDDYDGAIKIGSRLKDIFGRDNFFIELQDHGIPEQDKTNPDLLKIAKQLDLPLLLTNDSHYVTQDDQKAHDALLCIQTSSRISDEDRFRFHGDQHYFKSAAEMRHLFSDFPDACDNTLWIVERANVSIADPEPKLPKFELPEGYETAIEYLTALVKDGSHRRWGDTIPATHLERLAFELGVIADMGFSDYFLIVWDLIEYARSKGARVGPGRGSAAGSAVSYCLGITDLDPIKYDLLFERFLNPGRVTKEIVEYAPFFGKKEEFLLSCRDGH